MNRSLIEKYNTQGPRYTSYPTVPYWDETPPSEDGWMGLVRDAFQVSNASEGISLYIHLPYCESLCTYCGCNTRITVNHGVESPYIEAVLSEWRMYLGALESRPRIQELHLGGGTPTFFSAENLKRLVGGILDTCEPVASPDYSFEGHPNNTRAEHLQALYDLGFRRVSFGIQDFDPRVQEVVNRIQTFDQVRSITEAARRIGYTSVNFDLIYGLPLQQISSVRDTVEKVALLRPDRIALYSYAHVPWIKPGQRKFTELDLPTGEEKRALYDLGRQMLESDGYLEVGMDHFALPTDALWIAAASGKLHRNFMGYTPSHTRLCIALGVSAIGDAWGGFLQNQKKVEDYLAAINAGHLPIFKGHVHTPEDLRMRQHILDIMCRHETQWCETANKQPYLQGILDRLAPMVEDGLVEIRDCGLKVTEAGRPFVRNICMAFDLRLAVKQPERVIFSATV
ncbi:MAG: oxygen-independent coproporphyrinogen III oxidase [Bacteroidia bacterium]